MINYRPALTLFHGHSVEFSPYLNYRLAVGTAQYFGIVGNGQQCIFDMKANGHLVLVRSFDTQDGIYDCSWSENNENHLLSSCANGSIKLWDVNSNDDLPIRLFNEHNQEVAAVSCNTVDRNIFVSVSWDRSAKIWDLESLQSLRTFHGHTDCLYNAAWNVHSATEFATCSGDKTVKLWDVSSPFSIMTIMAHNEEVLALDWNKYNSFQLVTGSVDRTLKIWDLRRPNKEVRILSGHTYGIRRLKCSPFEENFIASVGYDMSLCLWNTQASEPLVHKFNHHTEFVVGLDFSLFLPRQVATCAWDRKVCIFDISNHNYFV